MVILQTVLFTFNRSNPFMNKKWVPYLLLLLVVSIILIRRFNEDKRPAGFNYQRTTNKNNRGFIRQTNRLEYSRHAECRMQCRQISRREVEEIMLDGKINYRKSDLKDKPCPSYALEGTTKDDQRVRIVYAQCNSLTKVITVIDLDKEWECDCSGKEVARLINKIPPP